VQVTRERIDLEASARKKKMDDDEAAHHADILRLKTKTQAEVDAMKMKEKAETDAIILKKKAETDADIESMRRKKMAELQVTLEYEKELESMRETKKHKTQSQQPLSAGDNSHGFICTRDVFENIKTNFHCFRPNTLKTLSKKLEGRLKWSLMFKRTPVGLLAMQNNMVQRVSLRGIIQLRLRMA